MFKFYPQYDQMDCGPACLKMIAKYYGKSFSIKYLRDNSFLAKDGVSLLGIGQAGNLIGMETATYKIDMSILTEEIPLPAILHWEQNHFVVLYSIKKLKNGRIIYRIADPGFGLVKLSKENLKNKWLSEEDKGIVMVLNPTEDFFKIKEVPDEKISIKFFLKYFKEYRLEFTKLFFGLIIGSILTLVFPFLTQALIDKGIAFKSANIVLLILLAQLLLFFGTSFNDLIKNWILLHIGAKISITIIYDFLTKLFKLPIKYFDTKVIGDIIQRISDHNRIKNFITSDSLFTLFSVINFLVFFLVLGIYDLGILFMYSIFTVISVCWTFFFLKQRRILDYNSFRYRSENQDSIFEIITGMQEIKLTDFQNYKKKKWLDIQIKLYRLETKLLTLNQYQIVGFNFINQLKNIIVTFIAANQVIKGNITLGAMLSISFIIGQMNSPINQLISFIRSWQDAKISMERLDEVHNQGDEENNSQKILSLNYHESIIIKRLSFSYGAPKSPLVLKDINLLIPKGKVTAIVGASGSGKTTLMKLLLKFYPIIQGEVNIGGYSINEISPSNWRNNVGVVMQDGYLFADTIARNIATGADNIDVEKLEHAIQSANLSEFIESLPHGVNTKIGNIGNGISGGEKQRILIARAIYKSPSYLFFDEATSALDADNENQILDNLQSIFYGKTVLIIAHRLSTVKNSDQIIVLNKGEIVEKGNHEQLVLSKNYYYNLIKNQLELGV